MAEGNEVYSLIMIEKSWENEFEILNGRKCSICMKRLYCQSDDQLQTFMLSILICQ